eukprot:TRINITY_DN926_c0_g1_i9.p2 TRINITY_DN926_c0_g1~~TRINITY_DN926_c0_g1_i9.p2  ORF type:complete len:294 (-),score=8.77 TRINITY_DN926_c0_g1_i9:190-1071(-)
MSSYNSSRQFSQDPRVTIEYRSRSPPRTQNGAPVGYRSRSPPRNTLTHDSQRSFDSRSVPSQSYSQSRSYPPNWIDWTGYGINFQNRYYSIPDIKEALTMFSQKRDEAKKLQELDKFRENMEAIKQEAVAASLPVAAVAAPASDADLERRISQKLEAMIDQRLGQLIARVDASDRRLARDTEATPAGRQRRQPSPPREKPHQHSRPLSRSRSRSRSSSASPPARVRSPTPESRNKAQQLIENKWGKKGKNINVDNLKEYLKEVAPDYKYKNKKDALHHITELLAVKDLPGFRW